MTGFFYNPNIHPFVEYQNRRRAVEDFSKANNIEVIYPEYNPAEFFRVVNPVRNKTPEVSVAPSAQISNGVNLKETKGRCSICWSLRLKATAKAAKEKSFTYFSTTLLVSPYQDQELLKKIGNDISKEEGINFYYEDFRRGFKKAHDLAKKQGIYCQKYCGCIYSEMERCRQLAKH